MYCVQNLVTLIIINVSVSNVYSFLSIVRVVLLKQYYYDNRLKGETHFNKNLRYLSFVFLLDSFLAKSIILIYRVIHQA